MIVVDANVIAYCWISGKHSGIAHRVLVADGEWHAPELWRSELRNVLFAYVRTGDVPPEHAAEIMAAVESALQGREHTPASASVLALAGISNLSAYDAEYVVVAQALGVRLVTADRAIIKAFPDVAISMEDFLAANGGVSPIAHQRRAGYRATVRGKRRTGVAVR